MKNTKFGSKKDVLIVNFITSLRFIGSFFIIPVFKIFGGISASLFSLIFLLTDFIDGYLARKLNSSTFFGALFDGTTDKMFGIISLLLLMSINPIILSIPLFLEVAIMINQNKKYNNNKTIKTNNLGKIKTWFLSFSIVLSFALIEYLNIQPFIQYIKYSSLNKIKLIEDTLLLFKINLPTIIFQLITLKSYNKELNDIDNNLVNIKEEPILNENIINEKLINIENEKIKLTKELQNLQNLKIFMSAITNPEFYQENKDMPIRSLTKKIFTKNN